MTAIAQLENISKSYRRVRALTGVSLDVAAGEIVGLVGPNGAGKTTLMRILARLISPDPGGCVKVGVDVSHVRYFAGEHTLPPKVRADRWLNLWSADTRSAPRRALGILSRGIRQRIGLEAMIGSNDRPRLILLDEPWEGLDPDATRWLSQALVRHRDAGAGIFVSSHRIHDLADVCDRCVFLVSGRISSVIVTSEQLHSGGPRSATLFEAFDRARAC